MYILPNKSKIDDEAIITAMMEGDLKRCYFLDTDSGLVRSASKEGGKAKNMARQASRYFPLLKTKPAEELRWLKEFLHGFIFPHAVFLELEISDDLGKKLSGIFKEKDVLTRFNKLLIKEGKVLMNPWKNWKTDCLYEKLDEWFSGLPIDIHDEFEGYDDCPICQAMKAAEENEREMTLQELKKVFNEAEKKSDHKTNSRECRNS